MSSQVSMGIVGTLLLIGTTAEAARINFTSTVMTTYTDLLIVDDTFDWFIEYNDDLTDHYIVINEDGPDTLCPILPTERLRANATLGTHDHKFLEILNYAEETSSPSLAEQKYSYYIEKFDGSYEVRIETDNYAMYQIEDSEEWVFRNYLIDPITRSDESQKKLFSFNTSYRSSNTSPVPEPTTALLFGAGVLGLAGIGRKRRA